MNMISKRLSALLLAALFLLGAGCGKVVEGGNTAPAETQTQQSETQAPATEPEQTQPAEPEQAPEAEAEAEPEPAPEAETETEAEPEPEAGPDPLFARMAGWNFIMSSGAGGWETDFTVAEDGSFSGTYYDYEMGSTGPGYEEYGTVYLSEFTGRFGDVTKISDYEYEVAVAALDCAEEPDTELIQDGQRTVYAVPYGLSDAEYVQVFLPGMDVAELPEGYSSWMRYTHFQDMLPEDWPEDWPEDLPFCGIYEPAGDCGFFSEMTDRCQSYLVNRVDFPGLQNLRTEIFPDGSYLCEDMDIYGLYSVKNLCFRAPENLDGWDNDAMVRAALDYLYPEKEVNDLWAYGYEAAGYIPDMLYVNGWSSVYAFWTVGGNEDTRSCTGRFVYRDGFLYAYVVECSEYDQIMSGEMTRFFLGSLQFSGLRDLSAASEDAALRNVLAYVIPGATDETVEADEVLWLSWDDEEMLEEYGIDPEQLYDDYAIVEADGDFVSYAISDSCPIYLQSTEEGVMRHLVDRAAFAERAEYYDGGLLVRLFLDEQDRVTLIYEPYRP